MYECNVVADSVAPNGSRLSTLCVTIPRMVLVDFNTHRDFSRNSASSRAIPVKKNVVKVRDNPFIPKAFSKNQKGMQEGEILSDTENQLARDAWLKLRDASIVASEALDALEVHKHWGNRPLEIFNGQTIIVSATRWENFMALRRHPDAAPEMRDAADAMSAALAGSTPKPRGVGDLHLPYVYAEDYNDGCATDELVKLSIARCARVSALTHEGRRDLSADFGLYERLASRGHMSPLEHAAKVASAAEIRKYALYRCTNPEAILETPEFEPVSIGNFDVPWLQHRKMIVGEDVFHG